MSWIHTHTGKKFYFLPEDEIVIDIEDIAHSLSNLCRWNGHTKNFYSVAEHCVKGVEAMRRDGITDKYVLQHFLLHDATEAYITDIPRPLKAMLQIKDTGESMYDFERALAKLVYLRFDLVDEDINKSQPIVDEYDDRMLVLERDTLIGKPPEQYLTGVVPANVTIQCWSTGRAKMNYLFWCEELGILNK